VVGGGKKGKRFIDLNYALSLFTTLPLAFYTHRLSKKKKKTLKIE
jgi:hypothetical protein